MHLINKDGLICMRNQLLFTRCLAWFIPCRLFKCKYHRKDLEFNDLCFLTLLYYRMFLQKMLWALIGLEEKTAWCIKVDRSSPEFWQQPDSLGRVLCAVWNLSGFVITSRLDCHPCSDELWRGGQQKFVAQLVCRLTGLFWLFSILHEPTWSICVFRGIRQSPHSYTEV